MIKDKNNSINESCTEIVARTKKVLELERAPKYIKAFAKSLESKSVDQQQLIDFLSGIYQALRDYSKKAKAEMQRHNSTARISMGKHADNLGESVSQYKDHSDAWKSGYMMVQLDVAAKASRRISQYVEMYKDSAALRKQGADRKFSQAEAAYLQPIVKDLSNVEAPTDAQGSQDSPSNIQNAPEPQQQANAGVSAAEVVPDDKNTQNSEKIKKLKDQIQSLSDMLDQKKEELKQIGGDTGSDNSTAQTNVAGNGSTGNSNNSTNNSGSRTSNSERPDDSHGNGDASNGASDNIPANIGSRDNDGNDNGRNSNDDNRASDDNGGRSTGRAAIPSQDWSRLRGSSAQHDGSDASNDDAGNDGPLTRDQLSSLVPHPYNPSNPWEFKWPFECNENPKDLKELCDVIKTSGYPDDDLQDDDYAVFTVNHHYAVGVIKQDGGYLMLLANHQHYWTPFSVKDSNGIHLLALKYDNNVPFNQNVQELLSLCDVEWPMVLKK